MVFVVYNGICCACAYWLRILVDTHTPPHPSSQQVWDLLQWAGKHPQAPVAVASKPHYFAELNLRSTLDTLLMEAPAFWTSEEVVEGIYKGGVGLLQLDEEYWVKVRGGGEGEGLRGRVEGGEGEGNGWLCALCACVLGVWQCVCL